MSLAPHLILPLLGDDDRIITIIIIIVPQLFFVILLHLISYEMTRNRPDAFSKFDEIARLLRKGNGKYLGLVSSLFLPIIIIIIFFLIH
jgi:hypothetical protein